MGKIISGKLVITHLIIPNQKGTPDSCDMENEEDFIPIQDKHNIITLGWIHTHPTQTAFLSSVDLHTHYSYQLMMPEAIAIVCSPMRDETAVFTLTQLGMDVIGSCTAPGFHPHPQTETPIFQEACHTTFDDTRQITILDIRGGS
jgi:STAM-binding protein